MSNTQSFFSQSLAERDAPIRSSLLKELERQQSQVELIASENIVSRAVLEAQGSVLTNKYAEGYPGKRYYGGCEYADEVESLAIDRVKQLFNAGFANVQPHSGHRQTARSCWHSPNRATRCWACRWMQAAT